MQNKHLVRHYTIKVEDMEVLSLEQYGSHATKTADIQDLNTRLFYNLVLLKFTPETSVFMYLVSKYDLVLHIIASLDL